MIIIPIADENPTRRTPVVTYAIIAINVMAYLIVNNGPDFFNTVFEYGLNAEHPVWYAFVTHMFLHGGFFHLLGNMIFLWVFGDNVEDVLGRFLFLMFYLGSGIAAGLTQMILIGGDMPMVGASGAVSGVLGFYLIMFPWRKVKCFYWLFLFAGIFSIYAFWVIMMWIGYQFVLGVLVLGAAEMGGVAYWAHIGGFVVGIASGGLARIITTNDAARTAESMQPGRTVSQDATPTMSAGDCNEFLRESLASGDESQFIYAYLEYTRKYGDKAIDPDLHVAAGQSFVKHDNMEKAVAVFERFVRIFPTAPEIPKVKYTLALIHLNYLDNAFKAMMYLRQAITQPGEGVPVDDAKALLKEIEQRFTNSGQQQ